MAYWAPLHSPFRAHVLLVLAWMKKNTKHAQFCKFTNTSSFQVIMSWHFEQKFLTSFGPQNAQKASKCTSKWPDPMHTSFSAQTSNPALQRLWVPNTTSILFLSCYIIRIKAQLWRRRLIIATFKIWKFWSISANCFESLFSLDHSSKFLVF